MLSESFRAKEHVKEDHICSICLDVFYKPVKLRYCDHLFCESCLQESTLVADNRKCPLCRARFNQIEIVPDAALWELMQKQYPLSLHQRKKHLTERVMVRFSLGNTTEQLNTNQDNKYRWQLFVKPLAGEQFLDKFAERVQIELHPTFSPSKLKFKPRNNQAIKLARIGWGTFDIGVKVFWNSRFVQRETEFHHYLSFDPISQKIATAFLTLKK